MTLKDGHHIIEYPKQELLDTRQLTDIDVSSQVVTFGCHLLDTEGFYHVVLKSDAPSGNNKHILLFVSCNMPKETRVVRSEHLFFSFFFLFVV